MEKKAKVLVIEINGSLSKAEVQDALIDKGIQVTEYAVFQNKIIDTNDEISKAVVKHMQDNPNWLPFNTTLTFEFSDGTKAYICLFDMH
jgi:sugar phosphate isomerase/epimerase